MFPDGECLDFRLRMQKVDLLLLCEMLDEWDITGIGGPGTEIGSIHLGPMDVVFVAVSSYDIVFIPFRVSVPQTPRKAQSRRTARSSCQDSFQAFLLSPFSLLLFLVCSLISNTLGSQGMYHIDRRGFAGRSDENIHCIHAW